MTTDSIPIGESVSWAWDRFKENAPLLVAVSAVGCFLPWFLEFIEERALSGIVEFWMGIVHFVVVVTINLGIAKITLRIRDGEPVEFANLFDSFNRVPWLMLATFIVMIASFIGMIFLIVPGIIIALRCWFIALVTVNERCNAIDALQHSWDVTRGFTFDLFLFGLLLIGINILGFICLGIGLLVTFPVSALAVAYIFRFLSDRHSRLMERATNPTG
jgi:uncharacterized membrane protein